MIQQPLPFQRWRDYSNSQPPSNSMIYVELASGRVVLLPGNYAATLKDQKPVFWCEAGRGWLCSIN